MARNILLSLFVALVCPLIGGCAHHKAHRRSDDATLTQADLPVAVEKAFARDHGTATIKQIDKQTDNAIVRYKIIYFDPDGTKHQVSYDREGDTLDATSTDDDSNR